MNSRETNQMIKKLKLKFIITNMVLIVLVMALLYVFLYVHTKNELESESINALEDILMSGKSDIDHFFDPGPDKEQIYPHLSTYIIDLNENNNTCYIEGFGDDTSLTEERKKYINDLINAVNREPTSKGILEEYNFRYHYKTTPVGKKIVFLDMQYEDNELIRLSTMFLLIGITVFVSFLGISIFLARIAVAPVEKSLKQQQQLISDASHELKTPITVISANTDILLSTPDKNVGDQSKWLHYIKDETSRMSSLVSDLLYLAKSDETIKCMERSVFDLSTAAYEIGLPFESICFEKNKKYELDIEPSVQICANESSVKQLIVIFLDNAVKYSDKNGSVALRVSSDSDRAIISVFNTGEPIPKEALPHLFERFFRVDTSRSRTAGGNGLGLSIAHRIAETNGGKISVSSDASDGTVFSVSFKKHKNQKSREQYAKDSFEFTE